jgi:hypothetical protein
MPVDLVEQDIAASYEVGCVLEELLRCVDALDEIAQLDAHCDGVCRRLPTNCFARSRKRHHSKR